MTTRILIVKSDETTGRGWTAETIDTAASLKAAMNALWGELEARRALEGASGLEGAAQEVIDAYNANLAAQRAGLQNREPAAQPGATVWAVETFGPDHQGPVLDLFANKPAAFELARKVCADARKDRDAQGLFLLPAEDWDGSSHEYDDETWISVYPMVVLSEAEKGPESRERALLARILEELVELGIGEDVPVSGADAVDYLNELRERIEDALGRENGPGTPDKPRGRTAAHLLVSAIGATGGLINIAEDSGGTILAPKADEDWLDLADAYLQACDEVGCKPMIEAPESREDDDRCSAKGGHDWVFTGTAYGGDDDSYHGEGRVYCAHCGADGDA